MYFGKPDKGLTDKAVEILKTGVSQICKVDSQIYSASNPDVVVTPLAIEQFTVNQAFEKNIHDQITITVNISIEEAMLLLTNYQQLRMSFQIEHVTQHYYQTIEEIPQELREFEVIIHNATDLLKSIQKVELLSTNNPDDKDAAKPDDIRARRYSLQVELLTSKVLDFRIKPTNSLGGSTEIAAVIVGSALSLGIESDKIEFVKTPENERKFDAVHVSMQPMESLCDVMQSSFGAYKEGLEYYYHDEKLYFYAGYDTNPPTERVMHLYRLPKDSYPGDCKYHYIDEGGNLHILIIDDVDIRNMADASVDTHGNYQIARRSDAGFDVDMVQNGKDTIIRADNLVTMAAKNESTSTHGRTSAKFVPTTNNVMAMSSEMASTFCKWMSTTWRMAWPWLVIPGMKVIYHYEEMSGLKMTTGILSLFECSLSKIDGIVGKHNSYAWGATIGVRLSPNEQNDEKISTDMLSYFTRDK